MFADHQRLDRQRVHVQPVREVDAEAQTVEEGAGGEDAQAGRDPAGDIGERIRRIGDDQQSCVRGGAGDLRHDVAEDLGVLRQQLQPSLRVGAVGRPAGLLVHPGSEHHEPGAGEVGIRARPHLYRRRQHRAVAQVRHQALGTPGGAIHHHDLRGTAAHHGTQRAGLADRASADDPEFHGLPHHYRATDGQRWRGADGGRRNTVR